MNLLGYPRILRRSLKFKADYLSRTFAEQREKVERNSTSDGLENFAEEFDLQKHWTMGIRRDSAD